MQQNADGKARVNRTKEVRPFGFRDKLGYLFGDFGNDFTFIFASSYLMVFYTKVLGISGAVVGALFLAARCVDAFTDVTMGRIVDRMRPAADGRFRPWIRRMCIPVAVSSTLMYLYFVQDFSYPVKMIYVVVTYLLWGSFCYTAINIPYGSMASVISADAGERASLSTYRSLGAALASLVIGSLVPLLVYETDSAGNQIVNPVRFTVTAVIFGVLAVVCYLLCYFLCTERVSFEEKRPEERSTRQDNVAGREDRSEAAGNVEKSGGDTADTAEKSQSAAVTGGPGKLVVSLLTNRPLLSIVGAALVLLLATMLSQTMNTYLFLDYFKDAKALSWVNLISVGGMLLVAPFASKISRSVGKKESGSVAVLVAAVVYIALFFLRIQTIPVFMIYLFLGMTGMGFFNMITWAFITDVIDYQEVKTGSREDGTVYAVYSFARKVGQALAGGLGGFALTAIGYVSEASSQTPQVSDRIYTVATLIPGICYLIVFLIMQFGYPLNRRIVEQNTEILQKRRGSSVSEDSYDMPGNADDYHWESPDGKEGEGNDPV